MPHMAFRLRPAPDMGRMRRHTRRASKAGRTLGTELVSLIATCATRRVVEPPDATVVGLKALLSIHHVYALPLMA